MLLDINLLFFHSGTAYGFTAGEFQTISTGITTGCSSLVINLGALEDLGIGDGEYMPKIALYVGSTGITTSSASFTINFQLQGSTNSTVWTTYAETGAQTTASYLANTQIMQLDLPRRPPGVALPQYYQINMVYGQQALVSNTVGISSGALLGGLVVQRDDSRDTMQQYPANFTVV